MRVLLLITTLVIAGYLTVPCWAVAGPDTVAAKLLVGSADPTFDRVASFFPPFRFPREVVGVPEHPHDIGVDYLGRLQFADEIGDYGRVDTERIRAVWLEIGDPPAIPASEAQPLTRRLLDGYLPIVILTAERDGLTYEQTVFGWSEGFSPDRDLSAFVRLRVRATKGALPKDTQLVVAPEKTRTLFPLHLAKDGAVELALCIPFASPTSAVEIPAKDFDKILSQTARFWRGLLSKATCFTVPSSRVNDAYRAWLAYSLLNVDKVNGYCEPHDGAGFYELIYGYSAALYCMALDHYGLHDRAARYLATLLHFQRPDGMYDQNSGLIDLGALALALVEHYRCTGDKAWLRSVAARLVSACDWIQKSRADAPKEGVTRGLIKWRPYCDYATPTFNYWGNTYCCTGMEAAASALEAIGMTADAARIRQEAAAYRADILASMKAVVVSRDGFTLLPIEPDTQRLLKDSNYKGTDYYGLTASSLLENDFLDPNDERARWVTNALERDGLISGICRWMAGTDHAYTYGYLRNQLRRGEARKVLLGFYGMLAHGMTRDTYSGVEVHTIETGVNMQTLPHLYSCTQQLETLRMILLREEGDTLRIGDAIPRAWLANGQQVEARSTATRFGDVSFAITSHVKRGQIEVRLTPPTRSWRTVADRVARYWPRIVIRLRHPSAARITRVLVNGKTWPAFGQETIELGSMTRPVVVRAYYAARR